MQLTEVPFVGMSSLKELPPLLLGLAWLLVDLGLSGLNIYLIACLKKKPEIPQWFDIKYKFKVFGFVCTIVFN